jgi:glucosamine--fructose-6-phosphate aminotransferase (isomerizing)
MTTQFEHQNRQDLAEAWRHCAYLADLLEQPDAVARTVHGLPPENSVGTFAAALRNGGFRRILLTGMGSSYWACRPLYLRLLAAGLTPVLAETSEVIHYERGWIEPQTLVVAVSQSGRSVEILRLLELAGGVTQVLGITNTAESPLAQESAFSVVTRAGAEATVACKTYLATLVALDWLGRALCGAASGRTEQTLAVVDPIRGYLKNWSTHVAELLEMLDSARDFFLVGRGASVAAAGTGGLILKESTHTHAEGMTAAAFRHGPFEMLDPSVFVLILEGDSRSASLSARLAADVRAAGARAAIVSRSAAGVLGISACPDPLLPLLEILPIEMMTLALAAAKGMEPGRFHLGSKVTTTE